jgi:hypothetical protein
MSANLSKRPALVLAAALQIGFLATPSSAAEAVASRDREHVRKTAVAHETLAKAHANAAKCLNAGIPEKTCHEQLARECDGAGIGKYCGMKHRH